MTLNNAISFPPGEPQPGEAFTASIERLPMSLNFWSRKFWSVRAKDALDVRAHVLNAVGLKRRQWCALNGPWFTVPVRIHLVYFVGDKVKTAVRNMSRKNGIDTDNLVPKHIIDALKGSIIADDTMRLVPMVINETVPIVGVGGYTEFTIEPYKRGE